MTLPPRDDDPQFRDLLDRVGKLPRSIEPERDLWPGIKDRLSKREVRSAKWQWWVVPLAAAAVLVVAIGIRSWRGGEAGSWAVLRLAGRPVVGDAHLAGSGRIRVGDWLTTDDSSRAMIAVGDIGEVEVQPGSRVRLVQARATEHRLALDHGVIAAKVDAPPRLFFVDTHAGTAIDLGCAYTLAVDSAGSGLLRVTAGYVEFQWQGRRSIVPLGASVATRPGMGPGIPVVADAPAALRAALASFDFAAGGATAVRRALTAARAEDAVSLWHLLERVDPAQRAAVFDRLANLFPPPAGVTRDGVQRLDSAQLEAYWKVIKRAAWRREILRSIGKRDGGSGTR